MKFMFQNFNSKSNGEINKRKFHKNLFLDDFTASAYDDEDNTNDAEYIEETDDEDYNKDPKIHRLNHLSIHLTDTIAEFVQDLSEDKFFINDLSFIFEMSRKRAISPYAIVVALLYLKRLKKISKVNFDSNLFDNSVSFVSSSDSFAINSKYSSNCLSNMELCLVSILLASKYLIDEGEVEEIYNNDWAEAADLTVKHVNLLEKSILNQMNWQLYVSSDEFWEFTNELTEKITRKKVKLQNYSSTYSDLDFLFRNSNQFSSESFQNHLVLLAKILFICSSTLVYALVSSFIITTSVIHLRNQLVNTFVSERFYTENSILNLNNGINIYFKSKNDLFTKLSGNLYEIRNEYNIFSDLNNLVDKMNVNSSKFDYNLNCLSIKFDYLCKNLFDFFNTNNSTNEEVLNNRYKNEPLFGLFQKELQPYKNLIDNPNSFHSLNKNNFLISSIS